jgi:hypothetical protein
LWTESWKVDIVIFVKQLLGQTKLSCCFMVNFTWCSYKTKNGWGLWNWVWPLQNGCGLWNGCDHFKMRCGLWIGHVTSKWVWSALTQLANGVCLHKPCLHVSPKHLTRRYRNFSVKIYVEQQLLLCLNFIVQGTHENKLRY